MNRKTTTKRHGRHSRHHNANAPHPHQCPSLPSRRARGPECRSCRGRAPERVASLPARVPVSWTRRNQI